MPRKEMGHNYLKYLTITRSEDLFLTYIDLNVGKWQRDFRKVDTVERLFENSVVNIRRKYIAGEDRMDMYSV